MAFNPPGESPVLGNDTAQYPTVVTGRLAKGIRSERAWG